MVFFRRNRRSIGLDVGSGVVKMVVVDHSRGAPEVSRVAMRRLPSETVVDGEVADPASAAEVIAQLHEEVGSPTKNVAIAIGGPGVIIKKIAMDRMDEREAGEVIRWEAEEHIPFDVQSVELDFQILDPGGREERMQVLLAAAKRQLIEERTQLVSRAGLSPTVVDVESFALCNAFRRNYPEQEEGVFALADVGCETTKINILDDGVPVLARDVAFGSRTVSRRQRREEGGEGARTLWYGRLVEQALPICSS